MNKIAVAPFDLIPAAARAVVADQRSRLPDLREAVVLLPTLHAAADFARALGAAAGAPALLLPRITTLAAWASTVSLGKPVMSRAARQAMLYRALVERDWLKGADLWGVAAELGALFDELTRAAVRLPGELRQFTRQLEAAYRARPGAALNFEARLVYELWHAATVAGGALDPQVAYYAQLSRLASGLAVPVYAVGLDELAPAERAFLELAHERTGVTWFEADAAPGDPVARTLAAAWPQAPDAPGLIARGAELARSEPASALAARLRIFGAQSAEDEARAVDTTVRTWLLEGKKAIAVLVNDRLVARRARALLERAQVLVEDEAGWALSTTSAATAIARWLDVASGDAYHRDLFDLLKSPFAFHDLQPGIRRNAVWRLETYARDRNVSGGLRNFRALAEWRGDTEVLDLLARIERGVAALGPGRQPIALWLDRLAASLGEIGVVAGLESDAAGQQLLELLAQLRRELSGERLALPFVELRRWLSRELETASFRDRSIASPVVFTHLGAAQLRRFDAVLLLGCDASHLPGPDTATMFFNQAVRAELGLPLATERVARLERQLAGLMARSGTALATWQRQNNEGEPNLLAQQLERLNALHRLAYGSALEDEGLAARLEGADVRLADAAPGPDATSVPAPVLPAALVPARVSASAYNALMACPYQFHARYALRLAELDDVEEEVDKRDYGELVHEVLALFHRKHPRTLALEPDEARRELEALSEQAFREPMQRNYHARAWLMRWLAVVPVYLDWQRSREQAGWSWHAAEAERALEITTPAGRRFTLIGRLDRVDAGDGGACTVIDYKAQPATVLKAKLEAPGEDVQLAVYALLWGGPVTAALFLSIERDEVTPVPVEEGLAELAEATRLRLATLYDGMLAGAPLAAQGADAACRHCEMRGLCRRNYWP